MGGGEFARLLAAMSIATAPQFLGLFGTYSMNPFDAVFWTLAALVVAQLVKSGDSRLWLPLGLLLGFALMKKISVLDLGLGLAVGMCTSTPSSLNVGTP